MSLYEPHMRARKASPTPEGILTRQIRDVLNHVQIYHWKTWQGPMSHKGVADMLEGIIISDDKDIYSWDGSRLHRDKENPRTEVWVRWEPL